MAEYIEKQTALKAVCNACGVIPDIEKENCQYKFAGCKEYYNVFVLLPADVRPVVRGEWIGDGDCIICSNCKTAYTFMGSNFCPNCGADMRGGDAE